LVLSHYFWPEPIPKPLGLAEALRDEGETVEVLTGFPNYPDGKLYPGYGLRLVRHETIAGIHVRRTFMYPDHGRSLVGRMINYASFMLSAIVGGVASSPFDVMYVWHPPLSIGVAAAVIGFLRRRPFVYDVQDIWPESAIASGFLRPGRLSRWMTALEKFVYRQADHILVVTDGAKKNLLEKGVPDEKITVAPHWYDDSDLRLTGPEAREEVRAREGWGGRFVVMFAGNLGMMQGLDTVVRACRELPPNTNVLVCLVGDGLDRERLVGLAKDLGVEDRLRFVERKSPSAMGGYFAAADALLVHLRASPLGPLIIPTKTIAYLAAGKPIVMANSGASADLVKQAGAGVVLAPDDPMCLARTIVDLSGADDDIRAEMGRRGRHFFEEHFTREATLPKYITLLARSASRRREKSLA
jgi:colanic acid biosynthesis glycosyl transferase WcaI